MDSQYANPVLIVGGCGHLGRHIALLWSADEPSRPIHSLDRAIPHGGQLPGFAQLHECEISNAAQVNRIIDLIRPIVIINTASPRPTGHDLAFFMKVNYDGTANLLDAAVRSQSVKAFVYTSSSSVVHDSFSDLVDVDESAPVLFIPDQAEPYHHSKAAAEALVLRSNGRAGILTAALRPSGLFGPNDEDEQTTARILASAMEGKLRVQLGGNTNYVDWICIDNAARAHIQASKALLIESASKSLVAPQRKVAGEAFLTNDEPLPFWDFARGLGKAAGHEVKESQIVMIPQWLGHPLGLLAEWIVWITSLGKRTATFNRNTLKFSCIARTFDISKAKARLGYDPRSWVDMEQAFQLATAPYRASRRSS